MWILMFVVHDRRDSLRHFVVLKLYQTKQRGISQKKENKTKQGEEGRKFQRQSHCRNYN